MKNTWSDCRYRLEEFSCLNDDWDGEGAKAPNPEILASANRLLAFLERHPGSVNIPPNDICVSPDGGILFAWQGDDYYREVEIDEPNRAEWMLMHDDCETVHWTEDI